MSLSRRYEADRHEENVPVTDDGCVHPDYIEWYNRWSQEILDGMGPAVTDLLRKYEVPDDRTKIETIVCLLHDLANDSDQKKILNKFKFGTKGGPVGDKRSPTMFALFAVAASMAADDLNLRVACDEWEIDQSAVEAAMVQSPAFEKMFKEIRASKSWGRHLLDTHTAYFTAQFKV